MRRRAGFFGARGAVAQRAHERAERAPESAAGAGGGAGELAGGQALPVVEKFAGELQHKFIGGEEGADHERRQQQQPRADLKVIPHEITHRDAQQPQGPSPRLE